MHVPAKSCGVLHPKVFKTSHTTGPAKLPNCKLSIRAEDIYRKVNKAREAAEELLPNVQQKIAEVLTYFCHSSDFNIGREKSTRMRA